MLAKMETNIFSNSYDAVLLAASVLKRLGCGKVDTFEQRLRSQKTQYLAQAFGVSPNYSFSLYLRGPYSTSLAHDLFKIKENSLCIPDGKFVSDELENRFNQLKGFISSKTTRELELIATLHWFIRKVKLAPDQSKQKLIELKNASEDEVLFSFNSLKAI